MTDIDWDELRHAATAATGERDRPARHASRYGHGYSTPRRTCQSPTPHGGEMPKWRWHPVPFALPVWPTDPSRVPATTRTPATTPGASATRWLP